MRENTTVVTKLKSPPTCVSDFMIEKNESNIEASGNTSLSLLERAKTNDQEAWQKIQKLYSPLIYRWCCLAGLKDSDSADVGQDVLIGLVKDLPKYDKKRAPFRIWLRGITYNKIAELKRKKSNAPEAKGGTDVQNLFSLVPFESDSPGENSSDERNILYERALEILNGHFIEWHVEVFIKVVCENYSPQDVAEEYKIRPSAVYNIKARILRCLREEFAELITD